MISRILFFAFFIFLIGVIGVIEAYNTGVLP